MDLYRMLQTRARTTPAMPLITYVDSQKGERVELSAASVDNAIAKTAGLLRDELDVEPGDRIAMYLPLHWQVAVWLGACAATGAVYAPAADPSTCAIAVTHVGNLDMLGISRDDVIVSLEPFGLPPREALPAHAINHALAARVHPDVFVPYDVPSADAPLLMRVNTPLVTSAEFMDQAEESARQRGLALGDRTLVRDDTMWPGGEGDVLGIPLVLGSSSLLIRDAATSDVDAITLVEGVTQR